MKPYAIALIVEAPDADAARELVVAQLGEGKAGDYASHVGRATLAFESDEQDYVAVPVEAVQ